MIPWNIVYLPVEVEPMERFSADPNWVRNEEFCHFLKVASFYLIDIAQDCSLGHCLTSRRAETSKIICRQNWDGNDLFYSNVIKRPLKLAC